MVSLGCVFCGLGFRYFGACLGFWLWGLGLKIFWHKGLRGWGSGLMKRISFVFFALLGLSLRLVTEHLLFQDRPRCIPAEPYCNAL